MCCGYIRGAGQVKSCCFGVSSLVTHYRAPQMCLSPQSYACVCASPPGHTRRSLYPPHTCPHQRPTLRGEEEEEEQEEEEEEQHAQPSSTLRPGDKEEITRQRRHILEK